MPPDPTTSTSTTTTSTSTTTTTSTSSSTSTTTTLAHLSGTAADKNSYPVLGTSCRISILGLDENHYPAGSVLVTADSLVANGNWSIATPLLTVGTTYLVLITLHETYMGDTDIAGAEFQAAI